MACWDELCLLCGIWACPDELLYRHNWEEEAATIAAEIRPGDAEVLRIVAECLRAAVIDEAQAYADDPPAWFARLGFESEPYDRVHVAVGCFANAGTTPFLPKPDSDSDDDDGAERAPEPDVERIPDGRYAEARRVCNGDSGHFEGLCVVRDGEEVAERVYTHCSVRSDDSMSNVFFCERCYAFLEAWVDRDALPPRERAFPGAREPLSFAQELYEVINSRKARRDMDTTLLPEINYQGIEESREQWQDFFIPCRCGVKHISKAIDEGLRGENLIPALLRDCNAWMFMRPDTWPPPPGPNDQAVPFSQYTPVKDDSQIPPICALPTELLLPILCDLPLPSLLALSATCRPLHSLITQPAFLDGILKEAMAKGSLRWILPLPNLLGEEQRARDAICLWLPEEHRPPQPSSVPVSAMLASPHLDRLAFVRECWKSDSMMARKRLWGQVKQFERLWEDYRLHGWQVDRFYSIEASGEC